MFRFVGEFKRCAICKEWHHRSELQKPTYSYCKPCSNAKALKKRIAYRKKHGYKHPGAIDWYKPAPITENPLIDNSTVERIEHDDWCDAFFHSVVESTSIDRARCLAFRYGILRGEGMTLEETAKALSAASEWPWRRRFGITRERVRQIETSALKDCRKETSPTQMFNPRR